MVNDHDDHLAQPAHVASVREITRAHLNTLLERFRAGDPTPLYFGDNGEAEAVIVPHVVVERLYEYEKTAHPDGEEPIVDIGLDLSAIAVVSRHMIASRRPGEVLEGFRRGDTTPFVFGEGLRPEPEAAIVPIAAFDRFMIHEERAFTADQQMLSDRVKVIRNARTSKEETGTTFDEFFESLDEKTKARIRRDRAKDGSADD